MVLRYLGDEAEYSVSVKAVASNVLEVDGAFPAKEGGFTLHDDNDSYDYAAYSTIYREVEGGVQFSNDHSKYEESTKKVYAGVIWMGESEEQAHGANSITASVFDNGTLLEEVIFNDENNWTKTYEIKQSHTLTINTDTEVPNYVKTVDSTYITYTFEQPYTPSIEEMLNELTDMILDHDERIYDLEQKEGE